MTSGRPRDTGRARLYEAESLVHRLIDRAGPAHVVEIAGTSVTVPVEARFASIDSVRDYVAQVLSMPTVRERFPRAKAPVTVRERRGHRSAEYVRSVGGAAAPEIAIPASADGRWALRELVVLHEIAHHLDDSGGAPHGDAFALCLIDLTALVLGPEMGFLYRVIFGDSGVPFGDGGRT